jgi:cytochrome bd-type quinol oxidase subunit 2
MGIRDHVRRWAADDETCATVRPSGEEPEEAARLGRAMKENARDLTLNYLVGCLLLSMLLMGIKRGMSFGEALVMANVILVALAAGLAGVWFGQRRQEVKPLWRMSAPLMLVSAIGACAGAIVPRLLRDDLTLVSSAEDVVR